MIYRKRIENKFVLIMIKIVLKIMILVIKTVREEFAIKLKFVKVQLEVNTMIFFRLSRGIRNKFYEQRFD
jgi:hypothetical protein